MCFTLGGGGSRGDVSQNTYYNRPWDEARNANPFMPGSATMAGANKINTPDAGAATAPATPAKNRSSLTTGGSA